MATGIGDELAWLCPSIGDDDEDLTGLNTPTLNGSLASVAETGHGATRAYSLNGVDKSITIPHHSRFNFGTGDFTVSLHCKPSSAGAADLVHKVLASGTFAGFTTQRVGGNSRFWLYESSGTVKTGRPVAVDAWHHLLFERDSGKIRMYVDGKCLSDDTQTQNVNNTVDINVGSLAAGGWGGGWFAGLIDDIRIYAKKLTPLERGLLSVAAYQPSAGGGSAGFTGLRGVTGGLGT